MKINRALQRAFSKFTSVTALKRLLRKTKKQAPVSDEQWQAAVDLASAMRSESDCVRKEYITLWWAAVDFLEACGGYDSKPRTPSQDDVDAMRKILEDSSALPAIGFATPAGSTDTANQAARESAW